MFSYDRRTESTKATLTDSLWAHGFARLPAFLGFESEINISDSRKGDPLNGGSLADVFHNAEVFPHQTIRLDTEISLAR